MGSEAEDRLIREYFVPIPEWPCVMKMDASRIVSTKGKIELLWNVWNINVMVRKQCRKVTIRLTRSK